MKACVWHPIEKMPKSIRKGYIRIYSFEPVKEDRMKLERYYDTTKRFGFRKCDYYMDIPRIADTNLN